MSEGMISWDDLDYMSMASLLAKFRIPEIKRYISIGCLCIHLHLNSIMMRGHGLDEAQMITLFPFSLSDTIQC